MTFGDVLRQKLSGETQSKRDEVLEVVNQWIDEEVAQRLEPALLAAVQEGKEFLIFKHAYINGFHVETAEIEALPAFQFLKSRTAELGLKYLAMSHKALGDRKPPEYPCVEIKITIPKHHHAL